MGTAAPPRVDAAQAIMLEQAPTGSIVRCRRRRIRRPDRLCCCTSARRYCALYAVRVILRHWLLGAQVGLRGQRRQSPVAAL
jgi:hypothetical protein